MVAGRKLLLADDSVTIRKVVELTFVDEGLEVTTTANGEHAIEMLAENLPDIVLADVHMPGLNGYQVCERIKSDERFRHIPVMLLVGSFEPFDEAEARRVGADDYLTKPFQSIRNLVSKVASLLGADPSQNRMTSLELNRRDAEAERASNSATEKQASVLSADNIALSTADTAPLPQHLTDGGQARAVAKTATVQATNASTRGAPSDAIDTDETLEFETVRDRDMNAGPNAASFPASRSQFGDEESREPQPQTINQPGYAPQAKENFVKDWQSSASRASSDAAGDDALLDLDEIETSFGAAEPDDSILDLQDESTARAPTAAPSHDEMDAVMRHDTGSTMRNQTDVAALADFREEMSQATPRSAEFVETQGEEFARFEGSSMQAEHLTDTLKQQTEAREVVATADMQAPAATTNEAALTSVAPRTGQITLEQLSPEVIDAIARRAVEHLSEKVVEEIAWEVVPVLSELLIRRRLEEEHSQSQ